MTVYQMVYALAKAHHHGWTQNTTPWWGYEEIADRVAAISSLKEWEAFVSEVDAAMTAREQSCDNPWGMWTDLGLRPSLRHVTQTGRLGWVGDPENRQLRICVYRPGVLEPRLVLDALVLAAAGGAVTSYVKVDGTAEGAYLRHLEAMEEALAAIHGGSELTPTELVDARAENPYGYDVYGTDATAFRVCVEDQLAVRFTAQLNDVVTEPFLAAGKEEE